MIPILSLSWTEAKWVKSHQQDDLNPSVPFNPERSEGYDAAIAVPGAAVVEGNLDRIGLICCAIGDPWLAALANGYGRPPGGRG